MISAYIKEHIIEHAKEFPEQEVCGVIVEDVPYRCTNAAENKHEAFVIEPDELDLIVGYNDIQGVYHTHWKTEQSEYLSPPDICNAKSSKIKYILHHSAFESWDLFDPANLANPFPLFIDGSPKEVNYYLKWPFVYNRTDCFSLLRAYYKGMLDISLPDFPRGFSLQETTSSSWNLIEENFQKANFRKLEFGELHQKNDVVVMSLNNIQPHHVSIIIDDNNTGLHNLGGERTSELFVYGGTYWKHATRYICRHRSFE